MALCDLHNIKVREDIAWDIENLFPANNVKCFNLDEFEQPLLTGDLRAMLGALKHNTYFKGFVARDIKLDRDQLSFLADCFKVNKTLEEVVISG